MTYNRHHTVTKPEDVRRGIIGYYAYRDLGLDPSEDWGRAIPAEIAERFCQTHGMPYRAGTFYTLGKLVTNMGRVLARESESRQWAIYHDVSRAREREITKHGERIKGALLGEAEPLPEESQSPGEGGQKGLFN